MRRSIALTAAMLIAPALATATSTSAQAAPADPANALRQQFKAGHGVQITQTARTVVDGTTGFTFAAKGRLQFGPTGPVAYDITTRMTTTAKGAGNQGDEESSAFGSLDPYRTINVGNRVYVSGGAYGKQLPEGKTWVSFKGGPVYAPAPDVLEPAVLTALVKAPAGRHSRDGLRHQGTLTYAELYKISSSFRTSIGARPTDELGKSRFSWRLWLDGKGLPRRVTVSEALSAEESSMTSTVETRYTGWGSKVTVTAPPADQVVDAKDLPAELPDPKELVNALTTGPAGDRR
ncbi:hypothetical protein [Planomonospora sp. ID82291]|uniref:hypothetical protein n=1 Tax=Planomonospora sp. ID82291 TaxID=2738136 RepID=UPI0018C36C96|nr:hypothetical protein [Planomonospora sp. ID82291]MBG0813507.1 hypothetical protein [Planomonospora sp. ID82291]